MSHFSSEYRKMFRKYVQPAGLFLRWRWLVKHEFFSEPHATGLTFTRATAESKARRAYARLTAKPCEPNYIEVDGEQG